MKALESGVTLATGFVAAAVVLVLAALTTGGVAAAVHFGCW
jgi:hypothetical protein